MTPVPNELPIQSAARLKRPTTEIILCTYNGAQFIEEQFKTIFAQSEQPGFISIYDDQSSDNTVTLVRQIIVAQGLTNVAVQIHINHSNLGYAANFANAIARAQGDVLFLCDQDDRWHKDKIRISLNLLQSSRVDMMFSDGLLIDAQGEPLEGGSVLSNYGLHEADIVMFAREPVRYLVRRNYVNGAAMAIRREAAQAALPVPGGMPHDYWLAIWCALHGGIVASADLLYEYRQHSRNTIGVGLIRWQHQWASILRQPHAPRLRELNILTEFLPRIQKNPGAIEFAEKHRWLQTCAAQKGRLERFLGILRTVKRGYYRRFGVQYALVRDLLSILRMPK